MRFWWGTRLVLLLLLALAAWLLAVPASIVGAATVIGLFALVLMARRRRVSGNVRAPELENSKEPNERP